MLDELLRIGIPEPELREAAWAVLEALAERLDPRPVARRALARLAKERAGREYSDAEIHDLASRWVEAEGPLACVREAGVSSPGWFTEEQARELVVAAREDGARRGIAKSVWRQLVQHGWAPAEARLAAWGWSPETGALPNGQWLPRELVPEGVVPAVDLDEGRRGEPGGSSAARAALDEAVRGLMLDRPFHWALLDAARIVEDATVATMAVGITVAGEVALFYAPVFVLGLTVEQRMGVLLHEVHHVLFDHLHPPPDAAGATSWTLACEATANEWIPYDLPDPVTIDELGLPPRESTHERYARLARRKKHASEWSARARPFAKHRIVRPLAARPRAHDHYAIGPRSPREALEAAAARVGPALDADTRRMLAGGGLAIEELAGGAAGTLAWNELLRMLARGLAVRTSTRTYPSRRLPDKLGVSPGKRTRRRRPIVMAVVDTSASMTTGELAQVSAELARLVRGQVRVACVQCDDEIRKREWLADGAGLVRVHGRGGTDLRPPLSPAELRKVRPDLVVYFTDGHGPAPEVAPRGTDVLWVLTGSAPRVPARFGRVVRLRRKRA
ncbi:MAG: hypothetical protein JWP97_5356 [Labilithrix sp.]|nr:hypothetical protein [Labilithrix sp.]